MIKKSLQFKLIISYLAVALLTVLVVGIYIRLTSGQQFFNFVMEQQAALLKQEAADYYTLNGSWDGFYAYYEANSIGDDKKSLDQGGPPQEGGGHHEIRGKHGLVNNKYQAIMPFMDYGIGETIPDQFLKNLIAVEVNGETVAWIIPDTGYQFKLSADEQVYLNRTSQAVIFAALAGVTGAVLMGIVLARIFLKPIRSLISASKKMAAGDLEQQVPVHSQDELGQLSTTFNQMSADLARSDRQRRQLTADITHDLSTPLQVIAGYIEMLEDEEVTLTPQRIQIIMHEIDQLRRLVSDLSLLTTADEKELPMQPEPLSPDALLARIYHAYEAIALRDEKIIEYHVDPQTPKINVDEGRMGQVLGNLVDNALRYTPTGGKVLLSARVVQGKVQLRVQDTGRGIHPDDLPYVFDRFYKADKSRNSSSGKSGLGLAIAKALVLAQRGKIWVESDPVSPGTTFVLEFDPA